MSLEPTRRGRDRSSEIPGRGEPVEPGLRRRVESTTGERLDDVRIHQGDEARRWVDERGARGATLGTDVALGSRAGSGLMREVVLAHELAHAAQNRDAAREASTIDAGNDAAAEVEADAVASAVMAGGSAPIRHRAAQVQLRRCNGDPPPPKVKQAAQKTDPKKLAGFEQMVKGGVPAKDAADKMQLPKELTDAMAEAWKNSFPGGTSKEQGGLLVKKQDGSLAWVKATKSTGGSATMPYDKVPKGATPLADAHTHPYDKSEGGHKGVSFSGADLGDLARISLSVSVIHAGDRYFAVTKTKEFEDAVAASKDKAKYGDQIDMDWTALYQAAKGDVPAKAAEATKAICKKYDLVLYEGKLDGAMTKVATK